MIHIEVTFIGNGGHVKMSNNLRDTSHLQQKLRVWFFVVSLTLPFPFKFSFR